MNEDRQKAVVIGISIFAVIYFLMRSGSDNSESEIGKALFDNGTSVPYELDDLLKGAIHELEHTRDLAVAKKIAHDHLIKDPDYYRKLEKMENE